MKALLDSVIVIDHLNGIESATYFLAKHQASLFISPITRAEVLVGFDEEDFALGVALLDGFAFLPMDAAIADQAAQLRRRTRLKLPDAIQAAFALHHSLKLATRNTRDFPPATFKFVHVPY